MAQSEPVPTNDADAIAFLRKGKSPASAGYIVATFELERAKGTPLNEALKIALFSLINLASGGSGDGRAEMTKFEAECAESINSQSKR